MIQENSRFPSKRCTVGGRAATFQIISFPNEDYVPEVVVGYRDTVCLRHRKSVIATLQAYILSDRRLILYSSSRFLEFRHLNQGQDWRYHVKT